MFALNATVPSELLNTIFDIDKMLYFVAPATAIVSLDFCWQYCPAQGQNLTRDHHTGSLLHHPDGLMSSWLSHPVRNVLGMKITYQGPPALTGLFAQMLRDEGLEVSYQPPIEKRGGAAEVMVAVGLTISSTVAQIYGDEIKAAVRKLKDRSPQSKVLDENGKEIE